jgi:hypothetical protein
MTSTRSADKRKSRAARRALYPAIAALCLSLASCDWLKVFEMNHNPKGWGERSDIRVYARRYDKETGALGGVRDLGGILEEKAPVGYIEITRGGLLADGEGYRGYFTARERKFENGPYWDPDGGESMLCDVKLSSGAEWPLLGEAIHGSISSSEYEIEAAIPGEYCQSSEWYSTASGGFALRYSIYETGVNGLTTFFPGGMKLACLTYLPDSDQKLVSALSPNRVRLCSEEITMPGYMVSRGPGSADGTIRVVSAHAPEDSSEPVSEFTAYEFKEDCIGGVGVPLGTAPYYDMDYRFFDAKGSYWLEIMEGEPLQRVNRIAAPVGGSWPEAEVPEDSSWNGYDGSATGLADGSLLLYAPGTYSHGITTVSRYVRFWDLEEEEALARGTARGKISRWVAGAAGPELLWESDMDLIPADIEGLPHQALVLGVMEEGEDLIVIALVCRSY